MSDSAASKPPVAKMKALIIKFSGLKHRTRRQDNGRNAFQTSDFSSSGVMESARVFLGEDTFQLIRVLSLMKGVEGQSISAPIISLQHADTGVLRDMTNTADT